MRIRPDHARRSPLLSFAGLALGLSIALGGCAAKSSPGETTTTAPPATETPGASGPCCDPAQKLAGIEGSHCCADGSWKGDIGNGGSDECEPHGGDGVVCKP